MRNRWLLVPVALLVCVSQLFAQVSPVIGLAILNDGKRAEPASMAYEFTSFKFEAGTYQITLPDGRKWAGISSHVKMRIDYRNPPSQEALNEMLVCSRKYQKSTKILSPRIESMRKELERMKLELDGEPDPAVKQPAVMLEKLNHNGKEYTNIRATSMQGGKLGFTHDTGNFAVPAIVLNHAFLQQIKRQSPVIAEKYDFENLSATFIDRLKVGESELTGVRLVAKDKDLWTIESNSGRRKMAPDALNDEARQQLESSYRKTQFLIRRFDAAAKKEAAEEAAHIAQAELEELRRKRVEAKLIADANAVIEEENRIREAAMRKAEVDRGQRMQAGTLLLGALFAAWAIGEGFTPEPSAGTDWAIISRDTSNRGTGNCMVCGGEGSGFVESAGAPGGYVFKKCVHCGND